MFKLIDSTGNQIEYINLVCEEVARILEECHQNNKGTNKRSSVDLVHEIQFTEIGVRSKAHLNLRTAIVVEKEKPVYEPERFELEDGVDYTHQHFIDVATACRAAVHEVVDQSIMFGNDLSDSDIANEYRQRFQSAMRGEWIDGSITATATVVKGGVTTVIITVG